MTLHIIRRLPFATLRISGSRLTVGLFVLSGLLGSPWTVGLAGLLGAYWNPPPAAPQPQPPASLMTLFITWAWRVAVSRACTTMPASVSVEPAGDTVWPMTCAMT